MTTSLSLPLVLALVATGQVDDRSLFPQLPIGMELVYRGQLEEISQIPGVQHQRTSRFENTVFVLDKSNELVKFAVFTTLSPQGAGAGGEGQTVRLDVVHLDPKAGMRTAEGRAIFTPSNRPATLEVGFALPFMLNAQGKAALADVPEDDRGTRVWKRAEATDVVRGFSCKKWTCQDESSDWANPRADSTAWRRTDTVWISPQLGLAQKVERVVELREPARTAPTQRFTLRYELESRFRYPGQLFQDRKLEIQTYMKIREEAMPILVNVGQNRDQYGSLLGRLEKHLNQNATTPYRTALTHLKSTMEKAGKGEIVLSNFREVEQPVRKAEIGQKIQDFVVTNLNEGTSTRMSRLLGKPTLVVFYNPTTSAGKSLLAFARETHDSKSAPVNVLAMAVARDLNSAKQQHREMKLPFPIHDGNGMRITFGVEATPRIVLIDADGMVRFTQTGWGAHSAEEIRREIAQCPLRKSPDPK